MPEGKSPILTDQEREAHYQRVHDSVADRERGFDVGKEMETRYLTRDQRELLQEITAPGVPEHRVEALRDLALAPPSVGPEHGRSADPWHINRQATQLLKEYEPAKVQTWAKEILREEYPEGRALERAHTTTHSSFVDDKAARALESLRQEREQERATSFATPHHKECGSFLLSEANLEGKVVALRKIVQVPRAEGPVFGEVGEGMASWQRVASRMAEDAEKGRFTDADQLEREFENLGKTIERAPLGAPQKAEKENEIPWASGFAQLQEHAAALDEQREYEQRQEQERAREHEKEMSRISSRSKGFGMSR